jgi:hypothetical protein
VRAWKKPDAVGLAGRVAAGSDARRSVLSVAAVGVGALALGVTYLGLLSPVALNYDAQWTHLVIAQDYAREGRIFPWLANWSNNLPHMGSVINTWAFLVPGLTEPATRWMMALHTEFAFFVWTLVGVAAAIGSMLGRAPPPAFAWLALFLFPSIFVYDSNIGASADHYLAFFCAPLFLAAVGTARTLRGRWWLLLGIVASGAMLTKLQAAYILVPAAALVLAALLRALARSAWVARNGTVGSTATARRLLLGPLAAVGCVVVLTAPHFVKNIIYHRNPFFPFAQDLFSASRPTIAGASLLVNNVLATWYLRPPAELGPRIRFALDGLVFFSFARGLDRGLPYIGSLFTLSLPLVPFLRRAGRIRLGAVMAVGALALWAFTYRVDRNLQTFLPLLAAVTGAVLARAWELGRAARAGVAALIAVQAVWGADLAFSGNDRLNDGMALIRSGIDGSAERRFRGYNRDLINLGRALPRDAVVLLHNTHLHLGIDRKLFLDWIGFQGLIDHRTFRTSLDIYRRFKELGVTHVVYVPNQHRTSSLQEEVLFALFFSKYPPVGNFGAWSYLPLPSSPPPVEPAPKVVLVGSYGYQDGLYQIEDLGTCNGIAPELQSFPPPRIAARAMGGVAPLVAEARAVLVGTNAVLDAATTAALSAFQVQTRVLEHTVYVRKP